MLGLYGSYSDWDQAGGVSVGHVGPEAEWYLGQWTLQGTAGAEFGNNTSATTGSTTVTFDVKTRFYDQVNLQYYLQDNFDIYAGHRYLGGENALALGGEWGIPMSHGVMASLFAEGQIGQDNFHGVWGGLRFYFGEKDKSLIRRHREDDPVDWGIGEFGGLSNNKTTSGTTAPRRHHHLRHHRHRPNIVLASRDAVSPLADGVLSMVKARSPARCGFSCIAAVRKLPMKLVAYVIDGHKIDIRPAPVERDWMDASDQRYAYRCLPLNIANSHGWEILCPSGFSAAWTGAPGIEALQIHSDPGTTSPAVSHFARGILTFHLPCLFRTEDGFDLIVQGPINSPKDGICALTGIIETDWVPYTFTMNWIFTRPGLIRFNAGDPICHIFPVRRGELETVEPELRQMSDAPGLKEMYEAWQKSRLDF